MASRSLAIAPPFRISFNVAASVFSIPIRKRSKPAFLKVKNIGIAHDVIGAGRSHQSDRNIFLDQGFEEGSPGLATGARIFVSEIEDLDSMVTVQAGDFLRKPHRIAMTPTCPEAPLATVVAEMRTAARKLDYDRALATPITVTRMVYKLPSNAISIEISDYGCRTCCDRLPITDEGDAVDVA